MTSREVWIAIGLGLALTLITVAVMFWGWPAMAAVNGLTTDQLFELAKQKALLEADAARQKSWYDQLHLLIGAAVLGAIQILTAWRNSKRQDANEAALAANQAANKAANQALSQGQEDLKKTVDGMATRAEAFAKDVGKAEGVDEERDRAEAAAAVAAAVAAAAVLAERTKTDAAIAKAEDGKEPSTEPTLIRAVEAIEDLPGARSAGKPKPKPVKKPKKKTRRKP